MANDGADVTCRGRAFQILEAAPYASHRRAHYNIAVVSHVQYVPTLTAAAA